MNARKGDTEKIFSCSLHPEHPLMAFGCETNIVKLYDIHQYAYTQILAMHGEVLSVRFSPCGNFLATASSSHEHDIFRIVIWRLKEAKGRWKLEKFADDNAIYEAIQADEKKNSIWTQQFFLHQGNINTLEFIPRADNNECEYLASGSQDQTVRVWKFNGKGNKRTEVWRRHTGTVHCVRASFDGAFLGSAAADGKICIWRLKPQRMPKAQKNVFFKNQLAKAGKVVNVVKAAFDAETKSDSTSNMLYTQVVDFHATKPAYTLSFFPMVERSNDCRRYVLACGTTKRMFLLKVTSTNLKNVTAIDFADRMAAARKNSKPEWYLRDRLEKLAKENEDLDHDCLEVELDFDEELETTGATEPLALACLDTTVHEDSYTYVEEDEESKEEITKTEHVTFLVAVGGGKGGKLYSWVFSPKPKNMPPSFRKAFESDFVPYATLKRMVKEVKMAKAKAAAKKKNKTISKSEKEKMQKVMDRLQYGYVRIGEHMAGSTILGIALPKQYPMRPGMERESVLDAKDLEVALQHAGRERKQKFLLNRLRDEHKSLSSSDYLAVTVSDDETARLFKYRIKEPHPIKFPKEKEEKEEKGFSKYIKGFKGLLTNEQNEKLEKTPALFAVASGERSKTTKKMDGMVILQRDLTSYQQNLKYKKLENRRELRKAKARAEAEKKPPEFKFNLDNDFEKENRSHEFRGSKFTHFQSLADPVPPKKKMNSQKRHNRDQCEECVVM